jgi:hypothetical protein
LKKIQKIFSNALTLALLFILGLGLVLFLNSRLQGEQALTQMVETETPLPATEEQATPTMMTEATLTSTAEPAAPPDDTPEPTWTPAIVESEGTPPPLPSPPPTPTATPINPRESELISFDVPAGLGAISPDGKTMAFNLLQVETAGNPYNQVWLMDLSSKQIVKLVKNGQVGTNQVWSPDGKNLIYQRFLSNGLEEVGIIEPEQKTENTLYKNEDLLGYYWIDSEKIGLIRTNSIEQVDRNGRTTERRTVGLPSGNPGPTNFRPKPKVAGLAHGTVVVIEEGNLRVISPDNKDTIIESVGVVPQLT